jgi:hypothetical protein
MQAVPRPRFHLLRSGGEETYRNSARVISSQICPLTILCHPQRRDAARLPVELAEVRLGRACRLKSSALLCLPLWAFL